MPEFYSSNNILGYEGIRPAVFGTSTYLDDLSLHTRVFHARYQIAYIRENMYPNLTDTRGIGLYDYISGCLRRLETRIWSDDNDYTDLYEEIELINQEFDSIYESLEEGEEQENQGIHMDRISTVLDQIKQYLGYYE